jgi:hypothetical protein
MTYYRRIYVKRDTFIPALDNLSFKAASCQRTNCRLPAHAVIDPQDLTGTSDNCLYAR